jgi:heat shock protein HtpX
MPRMNNQLKTILLLGLLSALLVAIGGAISSTALNVFLLLAIGLNIGAYFFSDAIVLRMSRARLVDERQAPGLHAMVHELAERAGLPMPRIAVVPSPVPNAFATGRNPQKAVVAVSEGLLQLVDPRELRGVLAHELAHVANRDTLIASIAAAGATAITYIGNALQWSAILGGNRGDGDGEGGGGGNLLLAFLAPIGATMIQMGISRSREFQADHTAAELTGDPLALASALHKLQAHGRSLLQRGAPAPEPATVSLSIVNPFAGAGGVLSLFSTHPPIEARIERLRAMAEQPPRR